MDIGSLSPHPHLEKYYEENPRESGARQAFVTALFDRTAPYYDSINRVMSIGSGVRYRRDALERAGLGPGMKVLDVASGTGLTARAARAVAGRTVVGLDASLGMLVQARSLGLPLVRGLAESLPLASGSFDFLTMGYALRHVSDLNPTFKEFRRVLKPGGRLLILELTRPPSGWSYRLTRLYLQRVVPLVAGLGPGGADARRLMEYFWDTIERCVPPETIVEALSSAGFSDVARKEFWRVCSEYRALARGPG